MWVSGKRQRVRFCACVACKRGRKGGGGGRAGGSSAAGWRQGRHTLAGAHSHCTYREAFGRTWGGTGRWKDSSRPCCSSAEGDCVRRSPTMPCSAACGTGGGRPSLRRVRSERGEAAGRPGAAQGWRGLTEGWRQQGGKAAAAASDLYREGCGQRGCAQAPCPGQLLLHMPQGAVQRGQHFWGCAGRSEGLNALGGDVRRARCDRSAPIRNEQFPPTAGDMALPCCVALRRG